MGCEHVGAILDNPDMLGLYVCHEPMEMSRIFLKW